jgi:hypothetical protein
MTQAEKLKQVIEKLRDENPYKKWGDRDSYSDYRQGYNDALYELEQWMEEPDDHS